MASPKTSSRGANDPVRRAEPAAKQDPAKPAAAKRGASSGPVPAGDAGASAPGRTANRLSIRVDLATGARIGPGKVAVLEEIARSGSISAAGRALRISYRRTWELVEDLNATLGAPVVQTAAGGSGGGGASLTELGQAVVSRYRAIEVDCAAVARKHMSALQRVTRARRPE